MQKNRDAGSVFMALSVPFLVLGIVNNRSFFALGIVFLVLGYAMTRNANAS